MKGTARHAILGVVEHPRTLTVELETGDDPIRGRVVTAAGRTCPFTGWIGLFAALEAALPATAAEGLMAEAAEEANGRIPRATVSLPVAGYEQEGPRRR